LWRRCKTYRRGEDDGRGLSGSIADTNQAAGDAVDEGAVAADALRIRAAVANAAPQVLVGAFLLD